MAAAKGTKPFADENGNVYYTINEAARALGLYPSGVSSVLRGRIKQTGGHTFRFLE